MAVSDFDYYKDFSAGTVGDFVDSDFTVYSGVLDIVSGLPSGNALSNDPTDATNVVRVGYTAQAHQASVVVGVVRAYAGDGSDSTIALTVGSSGAGYNFSSSLGSENCYIIRWVNDNVIFYRSSGGAVASITGAGRQATASPADGDELEFSVTPNGGVTELRGFINGVEVMAYDDPTPLALTGGVASISFKGQENLNSSFYAFGVDGLSSPPSVSAADDITSEGDTAEFTLADNTNPPDSATLNGTDVGTLTLVSGSTYSYTAPLIADDGTADLVVSVDSTTASAIISYANSYPYELVTHGEPDTNSIFYDTAFATDGQVEWGVVTDFDSGVVIVDWAAMDAAEDELNDVALHSAEVAAGESTATFKYFVPESGASGTFQATITVAEDVDTTPDAFSFTDQTGVEPESVDESNAITITGVDAGEDIAVTITGGQYAVSTDGGSSFGGWTSAGTNVQLNDQIKVRNTASSEFSTAANTTLTAGGVSDTFTRTTRAAVLPTLDTPIPGLDLGETDAVNLDLDDHFSGASSYALTGIPTDSGLSFSGSVLSGNVNKDDITASPFNLTATAFSADGSIQDVFEVVVVDDIVPVISINSLTTIDTTPVVTGSAGDAASLTLVVNSVTYNPTPSAGTWSQQLPELALDTYPMTLNGQDAAGNDAVEATATLRVVDEVSGGNSILQPVLKPILSPIFEDVL